MGKSPLRFLWIGFLLLIGTLGIVNVIAQDNPELVVVPGSFQSELGCSDDWQPDCESTALTFNEDSGLWEGTFSIPAGSYEYKVALNGGWDQNYGLDGEAGGANIPLVLDADMDVSFAYDHSTGIITDSVNGDVVATPAEEAPAADIPSLVNVPGTIQPELGCEGEWAPDCEATLLNYIPEYDIWERTFENLPAGGYEYKVALNGTWDENYGAFADPGGANIVLTVTEDTPITFIYDDKVNWIMDDVRYDIVTAPGSYQDEIGCANEWAPECMLSWLQDVDGDGIYTMQTNDIPAGDYEVKAAIDRTWDVSYGEGGAADGANIAFTVAEDGDTVSFTYDSNITTLVVTVGGSSVSGADLRARRAHWVSEDTIAWEIEADDSNDYRLLYSADSSMLVSVFGLEGDFESFDLAVNPDGLSDDVLAKFPHLAGYTAFTLSDDAIASAGDILTGQIAIAAYRGDNVAALSGLQIPGVLDALYTYEGDLGAHFDENGVPTFTVWAPTAQNVSFNLYADAAPNTDPINYEMTHDAATGTWSVTGETDWYLQYYTYVVDVYAPTELALVQNEVTDPYSVALSQNSVRTLVLDLEDPEFMPEGWQSLVKPDYGTAFEDITVYELHLRDFSIFDETVPEDLRGTYLAFTVLESNGMQHLANLAQAGLTHLHLLPTFDIATINENRSRHFAPDYEDFADIEPNSEVPQAEINQIRDLDGFNWGYDPLHFMAPEGSYATAADGAARVIEYRQMVQAINNTGLRFVQDVVFNHTNASGQNLRSIFDRVVPGYYHRLDATGNVTTSTCCQNTATEHNMMRRLMIDTLVLNAIHYKIDAFRFDLMGHHMLADMVDVRSALDSLTLEEHGIDGASIYVYGEGWNFGEVENGVRGINATQFNVAGTGIGTFNDRLRDAVRGGSPFGGRDEQGVGNGLFVLPNGLNPLNENLDRALLLADLTRVGLAGNLQTFTFTDRTGETATGLDVDYNGSPAGYTLDPQENVIYVSKHDNETLYDNIVYRLPEGLDASDVTRLQNLSLSYVMYSQGVPFFHAGSDILRSKSLDRDSYNSSDWFNRLDWTYQSNNFGVGMPPEGVNSGQWNTIRPILANEALVPTADDIQLNLNVFQEMLQIRYSSPLFRLETAQAVQDRLAFHNTGAEQTPGVIVMSLSDTVGDDLDPNADLIVVVFNATPNDINYSVDGLIGAGLELHPVQQNSFDTIAQSASFDAASGTLNVPAWTTSVFVAPQS
ncbi:MAG: pullulanase-type alpha-1,6-glucosidase [Phototrophicaceae bacterium]